MKLKNILTFFALGLIFIACDDTNTLESVDNTTIPDSNVSFGEHIYPVLQVKCAYSGCHTGSNPAGEIDLSSYAGVTADIDIVRPGDAANSRLVWAITGVSGVNEMPPTSTGLVLTDNQIQGIKTWINEAAEL